MPVALGTVEEKDTSLLPKLQDAMRLFNLFLDGHDFAVGDHITVADFALVATVSSMEASGELFSIYSILYSPLAELKRSITYIFV